jgi:hypothetical protein
MSSSSDEHPDLDVTGGVTNKTAATTNISTTAITTNNTTSTTTTPDNSVKNQKKKRACLSFLLSIFLFVFGIIVVSLSFLFVFGTKYM